MIQLIRVDDRLLHGQVAYSWKAELGYEALVIASDVAAADEFRKNALKMAKPNNVLLAIRSVQDAIVLLNNPRLKNLKVFVVTDTIANANQIIRGVAAPVVLNIGGIQKAQNKKPVTSFAYLNSEEEAILKKLTQDNYQIEFRLVPTDPPKSFQPLQK